MAPRVLVVDNDLALQTLLNVLLTRAGFECDFVSDGLQALKRLELDGDYRVIMLDLILPGMSGLEVLDHLRKEHPSKLARTIVLTSASKGMLERLDTSQIHAVIQKPFDIQDVIQLTTECALQE